MTPDEQEARSRVFTRCAIVVPLSSGKLAVFNNDRRTLINIINQEKWAHGWLCDAILEAAKPTTIPIYAQPKRQVAKHFNAKGEQTDKINIENLTL